MPIVCSFWNGQADIYLRLRGIIFSTYYDLYFSIAHYSIAHCTTPYKITFISLFFQLPQSPFFLFLINLFLSIIFLFLNCAFLSSNPFIFISLFAPLISSLALSPLHFFLSIRSPSFYLPLFIS